MTRHDNSASGEARRRVDWALARLGIAARVIALAAQLGNCAARRREYRRPRWAVLGGSILAGEGAGAISRTVRRHTPCDTSVGTADTLTGITALLIEMLAGLPAKSADSRPTPQYTFVSTATAAVGLGSRRAVAAATAATALAAMGTALGVSKVHAGLPPSASTQAMGMNYLGIAAASRLFAEELRSQADGLDGARETAVAAAEALAAEQERHRQLRLLHDSALQVLESAAGGWDLKEGFLQRIDGEIARLRQSIDAPFDSADSSLSQALSAVREECALLGLEVSLQIALATDSEVNRSATDALADATREALMNVHKHARVAAATVRVSAQRGRVQVIIEDRGRGFDPRSPAAGYGLSESIRARLQEIGGHAEVYSAVGAGTRVVLRSTT